MMNDPWVCNNSSAFWFWLARAKKYGANVINLFVQQIVQTVWCTFFCSIKTVKYNRFWSIDLRPMNTYNYLFRASFEAVSFHILTHVIASLRELCKALWQSNLMLWRRSVSKQTASFLAVTFDYCIVPHPYARHCEFAGFVQCLVAKQSYALVSFLQQADCFVPRSDVRERLRSREDDVPQKTTH